MAGTPSRQLGISMIPFGRKGRHSRPYVTGDVIIGKDGRHHTIERISQRYEEAFPVSNLTIGEYHNYAVGIHSILVHNQTICGAGQAALQDMLDSGTASYDEIARLVKGFDNADEVLDNLVKSTAAFHLHHTWPKYLGGPTKQDLVRLPKNIHDAYHRGLGGILDRRRGAEYYDALSAAARKLIEQKLAKFTKEFDAQYGTKLWEAILKNGFPGS